MNWFFENAVMLRKRELWPSARAMLQMRELHDKAGPGAYDWPPCFIAHGTFDSIVPVEGSVDFLAFVASLDDAAKTDNRNVTDGSIFVPDAPASSKKDSIKQRKQDFFLPLEGLRHSFENTSSSTVMKVYGVAMAWLDDLEKK